MSKEPRRADKTVTLNRGLSTPCSTLDRLPIDKQSTKFQPVPFSEAFFSRTSTRRAWSVHLVLPACSKSGNTNKFSRPRCTLEIQFFNDVHLKNSSRMQDLYIYFWLTRIGCNETSFKKYLRILTFFDSQRIGANASRYNRGLFK